jgi:hypothetical protein
MKSSTTTNRRETGTNGAESARKEGLMASTATVSTTIETEVREFAREFPTPSVQRAVALCEAGTLTWAQVHEIFRGSLAKGLSAVAT